MVVEVVSARNPEIVYQVDPEAGTCTCPQWQLGLKHKVEKDGQRRECKHLRQVMELSAGVKK